MKKVENHWPSETFSKNYRGEVIRALKSVKTQRLFSTTHNTVNRDY